MTDWQPLSTAPTDGTKLIFWVSTNKGFEDITASFYYDNGWKWCCDDTDLKRPDLVKGWQLYPQPPKDKE